MAHFKSIHGTPDEVAMQLSVLSKSGQMVRTPDGRPHYRLSAMQLEAPATGSSAGEAYTGPYVVAIAYVTG